MIYEVAWNWWEDYNPVYLEGKEVKDWKDFCRSLIPETIENLLKEKEDNFIGWDDVFHELIKILEEKHDYKAIRGVDCIDFWGSIIRKDDQFELCNSTPKAHKISIKLMNKIFKHNKEVDDRMDTE